MYEIEQKFLYNRLPNADLKFLEHTVVYRQYLSIEPEIRINRRVFKNGEERYHLTIKSDKSDIHLLRRETKIQLSENQYFEILEINDESDLVIDIYEYQIDANHSISFKECRGVDIKFAEIEYLDLNDYQHMQRYISKWDFLGKEVTKNDDFYVKNIWRRFCGK